MINKKGDSSTTKSNQNKDMVELLNEAKRNGSSSNDQQDCVCSNDQLERTKEAEKGTELNNQKNPEDQETGSVSQEKEDSISDQEAGSVSQEKEETIPALSKLVEVNINEAQVPSDTEPLLLLTNGIPKPNL